MLSIQEFPCRMNVVLDTFRMGSNQNNVGNSDAIRRLGDKRKTKDQKTYREVQRDQHGRFLAARYRDGLQRSHKKKGKGKLGSVGQPAKKAQTPKSNKKGTIATRRTGQSEKSSNYRNRDERSVSRVRNASTSRSFDMPQVRITERSLQEKRGEEVLGETNHEGRLKLLKKVPSRKAAFVLPRDSVGLKVVPKEEQQSHTPIASLPTSREVRAQGPVVEIDN